MAFSTGGELGPGVTLVLLLKTAQSQARLVVVHRNQVSHHGRCLFGFYRPSGSIAGFRARRVLPSSRTLCSSFVLEKVFHV